MNLYLEPVEDVDDAAFPDALALGEWLSRAPISTAQGRAIVRLGLAYIDALAVEGEARKVRGDG